MPRRFLVAVLALLAAGLGATAVIQFRALAALRAELAARGPGDDSDLLKKLADLQRAKADLEAALAARDRMGPSEAEGPVTMAGPEGPSREGGPANFAGPGNRGGPNADDMRRMAAFMENPEVQRLQSIQRRAEIERRYADLFRRLNLPPAQLEQLKTLLAEREFVNQDVMLAARAQGIGGRDNRDQIRSLVDEARGEVDSQIKSLLGEQSYGTFENYQSTGSQRQLTSQLSTRLSYTSAPLSSAQSDQLTQLLAANASSTTNNNRGGGGGWGGFGGGGGGNNVAITDAAILQAQTFLSAPQVSALQQMQAEQKAQQQLNEMTRAARQARDAARAAEAGGAAAPATPRG